MNYPIQIDVCDLILLLNIIKNIYDKTYQLNINKYRFSYILFVDSMYSASSNLSKEQKLMYFALKILTPYLYEKLNDYMTINGWGKYINLSFFFFSIYLRNNDMIYLLK